MKMILIPNCASCPHGARWNLEGTEYMCALKGQVTNAEEIPPWCELKDAMTTIKAFVGEVIKNKSLG